ncbi:MAG: peptidylprolyl isomerase [Planctomycetota bacterium]|jgi:cyclophilin family peptidyl-prolyl cis-trans isomerase
MVRKYLSVGLIAVLAVFALTGVSFIAGCSEEEVTQDKQINEETEKMEAKSTRVKMETSMGDIVIELNDEAAPVTVKNFLDYVEKGFYDGTIFHRVIANFMIQGGGFGADMQRKATDEPIINEASNGLKNDRGTIAMARTSHPDSASSQFFINHRANPNLNYTGENNPGYAVFGKVVEGIEVVDKIAAVETTTKGPYRDVPAEPVLIKSVKIVQDK